MKIVSLATFLTSWRNCWRKKEWLKLFVNITKKLLNGSTNGTSHLKRLVDKCAAKNLSNVGTSQSQISFTESGDMGNFSYSNVRIREGLAIYTATVEQPFIFGADPRFECF